MRRTLRHFTLLAALLVPLAWGRGVYAQASDAGAPADAAPSSSVSDAATSAAADDASAPSVPPATETPLAESDGGAACAGPRVAHVRFAGLMRVAAADIRTSFQTHEHDCFVRTALTHDAHSLWDLGFFSDVQVAVEPNEDGTVDVRFALVERPSIHEIRFEGNDNLENDKLKEGIELRDGAVVSESAIRRAEQKIRDLYAEKGYFLAEVHGDIRHRDGADNEADIVFRIRENAQVQIRAINFVGNANISSDELRGVMQSAAGSFFSFLTQSGTYREEMFRNDIDLLHAAYYDRGYLNVEIENPRIALTPDRQFLDITIFVREGIRYQVGRFRVSEIDENDDEIEPLGGRRRVREMFHLGPGDWFSRTSIGHDILALQTHYRDAGYATVEVAPDIQPHAGDHTVDLNIRVRRGPITFIDRIVIRGNQKTSDRVIRRELQIYEGERYNESRYQDSRRRAMQLGYFERVDISTEPVPDHPDRIIVNVEVTERPTGTFQVGAGISSVEAFILTAQIQQQNLFGRGQSFTLQAQVSALRQIFSARFVEPYLFDSNWTGAIDLYNTLRAYTDFTRYSTGGSLSAGYPLIGLNDLRLAATYTAEQVNATTSGAATLLGGAQTQSALAHLPLPNLFQNGFTSAVGVSLTVDTRDNRLFPTSGIYARAGVEVADPYTASQNTYVRWSGFFRFYVPVIAGIVFKANLTGGLVTSRSATGVPIFERYFLGGILDVRGYRLRTIGPRLPIAGSLDPNAAVVANGANIGGNLQLYSNVELEFPILDKIGLRGVIFTDAGNVWNTESQFCNGSRGAYQDHTTDVINPCIANPLVLRTSVGFGLRWFSPLGLLRFEWGFPLQPLSYEQPSTFDFTIGNFF